MNLDTTGGHMRKAEYLNDTEDNKNVLILLGTYIFFLVSLLSIGMGGYLVIFFPLLSFAIGLFLYKNYPKYYIGFTLFLFFTAPEIRRIIDYQWGSLTFGPWNFTPFLVASICLGTLVKNLPKLRILGTDAFISCLIGVSYSYLTGLINNPISSRTFILFLQWFSPIAFAFYLVINWPRYSEYKKATQYAFLWGSILMGTYGIFQYLIAPEWDKFFLLNTDFISFGKPEPLGIRVWSTMEAPHTFATAMMAGLMLLFSNTNVLTLPAAGVGYLAFFLTQARTVWISWVVGLITYILGFGGFRKIQVVISVVSVTLIFIVLTQLEPFSELIINRLQTFSDLEGDISLQVRSEAYNTVFNEVITNILGNGIGASVSIFETGIGPNDSTILPMLLTFGWLGIIPYFGGIALMIYEYLNGVKYLYDTFSFICFSIAIAILSQIGLNYIFVESMGMLFWFFIGISIAGKRYELAQNQLRQKQRKNLYTDVSA